MSKIPIQFMASVAVCSGIRAPKAPGKKSGVLWCPRTYFHWIGWRWNAERPEESRKQRDRYDRPFVDSHFTGPYVTVCMDGACKKVMKLLLEAYPTLLCIRCNTHGWSLPCGELASLFMDEQGMLNARQGELAVARSPEKKSAPPKMYFPRSGKTIHF